MSAPTHIPAPLNELLDTAKRASGGRLLALHTDLARSPAALAAYLGLRRAGADFGTFDLATRAAIMLTVGSVHGGAYSQAIAAQLANDAGMTAEDVNAVRLGHVRDSRLGPLLAVIREAARNIGQVDDATHAAAVAAGWTPEELTEAFVYLAVTTFVDQFTNFARTEPDHPVPASSTPKGSTT